MLIALFVLLLALKIGGVLPITYLGVFVPLIADVVVTALHYTLNYVVKRRIASKVKAQAAALRADLVAALKNGRLPDGYRMATPEELAQARGGGIGTSPSFTDQDDVAEVTEETAPEANGIGTSPSVPYARPRPGV